MKKVFFITLGCPKNSVDSEFLAGRFDPTLWEVVDDVKDADLALVNTCGFIQPAVEESIGVILDLERLKKKGSLKSIAVVGCMVNRYGEGLKNEFPTVDYWARSDESGDLAEIFGPSGKERRILSETPWTRYLKISEGCDSRCSFCTIPSIRGPLRSVDPSEILRQALDMAEEGAKELCLVGQDLTAYGRDLFGKNSLPMLLEKLSDNLPQDMWLRLFYLYPSGIDQEFMEMVSQREMILPYLDMPIQHVDEKILISMNRPPVLDHVRDILKKGRSLNPDFAFRTTLMVGFPGETEEAFQELLDFVEEARFDRLGAFTFYPEDGTKAAVLPDQVSQETKDRRYNDLMELQQGISLSRQLGFIGKTLKVLVEEVDEEDGTRWGRSFRDGPEVDGVVGISGASGVKPGEFVQVLIKDATEYDLFGEIVPKGL